MYEKYQALGGTLSRDAYEAQLTKFRKALETLPKYVVLYETAHAVMHVDPFQCLHVILGEIFPE